MSRAFVLATLLAASAGAATPARAGDPPAAPSGDAANEDEEAVRLFEQGRALYREGKMVESVAALEAAYAKKPVPVLQYNIARAEEALGHTDRAIAAYEIYLRDERDIADRAAIEQKVASLKLQRDERVRLESERDQARAAKTDGPAKDAPRGRTISPAPWIVAGAGVLGLGAGGLLVGLAVGKNDDAEAAASQRDALALRDAAETLETASIAALIAGGAIAGAGLIWGVVDLTAGGGEAPAEKATLELGPLGVGLTISF